MLKPILLTFFMLICAVHTVTAQAPDITNNDALLKTYLQKNTFEIDPSAQAVILSDQGYSRLNSKNLEFHFDRVIKFLDDNAISELGTINIPYKDRTYVTKIRVTTYNLENDRITEQSINSADIINEKLSNNVSVSKLNFPGVKKGSVVHYSYTIYKPATFLLPEWNFQEDYPVLYSEYDISLPSNINYNAIERLNVPMKEVKKNKELNDCESCSYTETYGGSAEVIHKWVRRNIPAFKSETYMSSSDNFKEKVRINITNVRNDGFNLRIFSNWEDFTRKYLYEDNDFSGQVFAPNLFLKEKTMELTGNQPTPLDKAKAIFSFVRNNFVAASQEMGAKPEDNIKEIFRKRTGDPEGINLLLVAMLRKAGLDCEPVLLSTRDEERLNAQYINTKSINYVIAKCTVDHKTYLLDASDKYHPFNILPPACYNGYCRSITKEGGTALDLDPDNIKNKTTIIVKLSPSADASKLLLSIDKQYGEYSAMNLRKHWAGDTAAVRRDIVKYMDTDSAMLTHIAAKNLEDANLPLNLHYEMLISFNNTSSTVYIDPFFSKIYDKNPLPQTQRAHMIEMDYLEDINYLFHFEIPKGFVLDDYPKSAIVYFGDKDNQLITLKSLMNYEEPQRKFSLNSRFISKTTLFQPEDYESLRSFYDHVLEEQHKKLILKKINN